MAKTADLQICLQLPDGPDRDALRAGLLAMQCIPVNLPAPGAALIEQLHRLALNPHAVVFLDISNALPRVIHRFGHILEVWPRALRARTVLTRLAAGHVSLADRAWVQSLGFADLVASFEDTSPTSDLRKALDLVASTVGLPALAADNLDRYLSAVPGSPSKLSLRTIIRGHTDMDAETLADLLQAKLDIRDRIHHFKKYPACFVGKDAVQWMTQFFQLNTKKVIETGQALQTLGLLHHVADKQVFSEDVLFFRLRAPAKLPQVNLGLALQTLRDRLVVTNRSYLGRDYPSCWIGQDAADMLCAEYSTTRPESQLIMYRLMQFGYFEHVVEEHGFIDGNYFYRFTDSAGRTNQTS